MVGQKSKQGGHIDVTVRLLFVALSFVAASLVLTACGEKNEYVTHTLSDNETIYVIMRFREERGAFWKGDVEELTSIANRGNAEAQYLLGMIFCYADWRGEASDIEQNNTLAHTWFLKAAKQGYDQAALEVAKDFFHGEGTTKDPNEALYWYEVAAEADLPRAQYMAGVLYVSRSFNSGNVQEFRKGIKWLEKAADNGYEEAEALRDDGTLEILEALDTGDEDLSSSLKLFDSFLQFQYDLANEMELNLE
jgi:hypothetical protein